MIAIVATPAAVITLQLPLQLPCTGVSEPGWTGGMEQNMGLALVACQCGTKHTSQMTAVHAFVCLTNM